MKKIVTIAIQHDYQTSERAGAGGMFQLISVTAFDDNEQKFSLNVDCGIHFEDDNEVVRYLKKEFPDYDFNNVNVDDDD